MVHLGVHSIYPLVQPLYIFCELLHAGWTRTRRGQRELRRLLEGRLLAGARADESNDMTSLRMPDALVERVPLRTRFAEHAYRIVRF